MVSLPRVLNPQTNPTGYIAAAGAVYAAAVMIYNAYNHHGVIDVPVLVAAIAAMGSLLARNITTPVADPKNGAGQPLVPLPTVPTIDVTPPKGPG